MSKEVVEEVKGKTDEKVLTPYVPEEEKSIKIDIDTKIADVLLSDAGGKILEFNTIRFKKLSKEIVERLRPETQEAYKKAYGEFSIEQKEGYRPSSLSIRPTMESPSKRFEIRNQDPNYHYHWARAQRVSENKRDGLEVVTKENDDVETFASDVGMSEHIVGVTGDPEHVLMREPIQQHMAKLKRDEEASKRNIGDVENKGIRDIERLGVKAFVPKD
jgi:hypothetical protein